MSQSQYVGPWYLKTVYIHVDAFAIQMQSTSLMCSAMFVGLLPVFLSRLLIKTKAKALTLQTKAKANYLQNLPRPRPRPKAKCKAKNFLALCFYSRHTHSSRDVNEGRTIFESSGMCFMYSSKTIKNTVNYCKISKLLRVSIFVTIAYR